MWAMPAIAINSPTDDRLALYRNLKDRDLRQRKGLFLAESEIVIERLATSPFRIRSVLLHPQRWERLAPTLEALDVTTYVAAPEVMNEIAGFPVHRGVLALAERGGVRDWQEVADRSGPLLLLEDVGDPDNVGSLFRAAAAFGYAGVLCSPGTADPLYRKAIRSSMGWTLHVPFAELRPWPEAIRSVGRHVIALSPDLAASPIRPFTGPGFAAILLGAEGPGLSDGARATSDATNRIPMSGAVDSLNVAVAASIAMYELGRRPTRK